MALWLRQAWPMQNPQAKTLEALAKA